MKVLLLGLLFFTQLFSGQNGFAVTGGAKKATIPFQLINNLIFIPVELNGVQLTFLLDTGVSETLLISLEDKEVAFTNQEKVFFSGWGNKLKVEGLKSKDNILKITDNYRNISQTIYIIQDEFFNFSAFVGIPVHGIIGYDFFQNHPVEIDYITKKITVFNDADYFQKKSRKFKKIAVHKENNKLYADAELRFKKQNTRAKLLIDIGNSDALWFFPNRIKDISEKITGIDDFLGRGFNGDIHGTRGRIASVSLGDFILKKPVTAIPDSLSIQNLDIVNDRKGSIGAEIMRRFKVIVDYSDATIYLKANKNYDDLFRYNRSGLEFKHIGESYISETVKLNIAVPTSTTSNPEIPKYGEYFYKIVLKPIFAIAAIRKDSPAFRAGLKKDDVLQKINGKLTSYKSLSELNEMMKEEEGKNFTFEVLRGGLPLKFNFVLKNPIPYTEEQ